MINKKIVYTYDINEEGENLFPLIIYKEGILYGCPLLFCSIRAILTE